MNVDLSEEVVLISSPNIVTRDAGEGRAGGLSGSVELGRRLLVAARLGHTALVLDLMAKGAPFTTDWLGTSPLHVAAAGAHVDTCAVLLRAGVSRDSRTKVERTPLHLAAHAGHAPVCELLLERGAMVDCRDMLRMTPLHWAAERGHAAVVAALLRHGADPHALSKFQKTPLSLAAARGRTDIVRLMEAALAEREDARSVHAIRQPDEQMTEVLVPAAEQQQALESIQRLEMQESVRPFEKLKTERVKIEMEPINETEAQQGGAGGAGAGGAVAGGAGAGGRSAGGAEALLRQHGITLLPHDSSTTVLNAIQSGRTIVLSDAGKLMLKDTPAAAPAPQKGAVVSLGANAPASKGVVLGSVPLGAGAGAGGPLSKGVILTAAPVKVPPAPGVKIFTLNNKLRAHDKIPIKKLVNPHDLQVKVVGGGAAARGRARLAPAPAPLKAKSRRAGGAGGAPLKIIMQRASIDKILANSHSTDNQLQDRGSPAQAAPGAGAGYMCVPAEFLSSSSPSYLRAQLLAAHRTIHELTAQLAAANRRLAELEPPT